MSEEKFIHNKAQSRYELHIGDHMAVADYQLREGEKGVMVCITHTGVPEALRGGGVASRLMEQVLADIEAQGLQVLPWCSFAEAYIERCPEWTSLVAK